MHETPEQIAELQRLLDESYDSAGEHLRSIMTPERRSTAKKLVETLTGMCLLSLATVTAKCEPMVSPVDGVFFKGGSGSDPARSRSAFGTFASARQSQRHPHPRRSARRHRPRNGGEGRPLRRRLRSLHDYYRVIYPDFDYHGDTGARARTPTSSRAACSPPRSTGTIPRTNAGARHGGPV